MKKPDSDILTDFTDGSLYAEHKRQHPNRKCLQILLFQDTFGPAAGVCKPIGFYYSGNIDPEYRTKLDLIQVVYVILEKSLQATQQEDLHDRDLLKKGLDHLMNELEDLKINSIEIDGQVVTVCLMSPLGDSLVQHQMGGFIGSFSAVYFCRF